MIKWPSKKEFTSSIRSIGNDFDDGYDRGYNAAIDACKTAEESNKQRGESICKCGIRGCLEHEEPKLVPLDVDKLAKHIWLNTSFKRAYCDGSFKAVTYKSCLLVARSICANFGTPNAGLEPTYPCDKCGKLRTSEEGGTTFTVCDDCWDKSTPAKGDV